MQEKLAESNRLREAAEQEWKLREAELLVKLAAQDAKIAELESGSKEVGLSEESIQKIEQEIGLL